MSTLVNFARAWKFQFTGTETSVNTIFVDADFGDDLRGNGTKEFPFQTLNKANIYANANSKINIVARGFFSEQISADYTKYVIPEQGLFCFNGNGSYNFRIRQKLNPIVLINSIGLISVVYNGIIINSHPSNTGSFQNFNVCKNTHTGNGSLNIAWGSLSAGGLNCVFIDAFAGGRNVSTGVGYVNKNSIFVNSLIYLDKLTAPITYENCLFHRSCTFYYRSGSSDIRLDNDSQTAAQKFSAIESWLSGGMLASGYVKNIYLNCRWTDNEIFNQSGNDWDYSLIYGNENDYPACWMDNGHHIGPFAPAIKFFFRYTADLTALPYEIEIKSSDKITIQSNKVTLNSDFSFAELKSKVFEVPSGMYLNGFNVCAKQGAGVLFTQYTDSIDLSESNRIEITAGGVVLSTNICYQIICTDATVNYLGSTYASKSVLMASDSVSLAAKVGTGTAYAYPIKHPSFWQDVQFKFCEFETKPSDFETNDSAYPYASAELFTKNVAWSGNGITGLRALRTGDSEFGSISTASDGKPLTSGHPEFWSTVNQARPKFPIRAKWAMMKLTIKKVF